MNPHTTPLRPTPGLFPNTPAPRPPTFRASSNTSAPVPQRMSSVPNLQAVNATSQAPTSEENKTPSARAARIIDARLRQDAQFPALETYVTQGVSDTYDIPKSPAWMPFQRVKRYDIPNTLFAELERTAIHRQLGVFADLHHGWAVIDNALYLWDYTHPNPELIGYEELTHMINGVKLVQPRPGVFVKDITHLLVVTTVADLHLIGVATSKNAAGVTSLSLYQTGMQVSLKGLAIGCIGVSNKTGRIFVGSATTNDIYEITYQQEEQWFSSKCSKKSHTASREYFDITRLLNFAAQESTENVVQIVVDDSRDLLYALSSRSAIRVFHVRPGGSLPALINKPFREVTTAISHMRLPSRFTEGSTRIISISPIPSTESGGLNLVSTTDKGIRIFFSATSGYAQVGPSSLPTSMQPQHVRLPPALEDAVQPRAPATGMLVQFGAYQSSENTLSAPMKVVKSVRYPPGYFLATVKVQGGGGESDVLFLSAPDGDAMSNAQEPGRLQRFAEFGQRFDLGSETEDLGLVTKPFAAASVPVGFANELSVQFDVTATEIAILTNTGVHIFRRKRLVDIFAAAMRAANASDELVKEEIKQFIKRYGYRETCATALAVACGQAMDVTADARVAKINDEDVFRNARKAFIEFGGTPRLEENDHLNISASDTAADKVRPSYRADGLAIYLSRVIRSLWKTRLMKEETTPQGGLKVNSTIPTTKLQQVQQDLNLLQEFLNENKTYIEGLAGPEALAGVASKQEEVALQGEHQIWNAMMKTIANIVEGIAFVMVLFDDPVEEIVLALTDAARLRVRDLTYEGLFCKPEGKDLAKELVKALVNRSIARGLNVDTVAEALRRRCGSFCSADDVVIFKAQEQLKKASEAGAESSASRSLLNDSLRLFQKVAGSLSNENLTKATEQYIANGFFAGAIRLALTVAEQVDRPNQALSWIRDGSPEQDSRKEAYEKRTKCYKLICDVVVAADNSFRAVEDGLARDDFSMASMTRRKTEAYGEINQSDDEVFQTYLYEWYLSQGWSDRLLELNSPYVISYLKRKSTESMAHADLLWKYYVRYHSFFEAAKVQLQLAESGFDIKLSPRIEYLSLAKANASTRTNGLVEYGRAKQSKQEVVRRINDLLDVANIQGDILLRVTDDPRLTEARKPEIERELDGRILNLDDLYNNYADQANYYDLTLIIYDQADYRNAADIRRVWTNLITQTHEEAIRSSRATPRELITQNIRELGQRLKCSVTTFSIPTILPILLQYAITQSNRGQDDYGWTVELFSDLGITYEQIVTTLEDLFYNQEQPWRENRYKATVGKLMAVTVGMWCEVSSRAGGVPFGSEENAVAAANMVRAVLEAGLLKGNEKDVVERIRELIDGAVW